MKETVPRAPSAELEDGTMAESTIDILVLPEMHPDDTGIMQQAYQIEFVVDNKILADECGGHSVADADHRVGPIAIITQRLLTRGWWPRQYFCPLVVWRRRAWNTLADALCNLSMDFQSDRRFEAEVFPSWQLEKGTLIQCHSDGGMRRPGIAAAACTLTVLRKDDSGLLLRTLLCAESVFISDDNITAPAAERAALTMAMREMESFTKRVAPTILNT